MTTAQVGYMPVHRWVKHVLGHTHTTVVVTITWAVHIPSLLVVNRWAADGEIGSHHDFRFRHDVWTRLFH